VIGWQLDNETSSYDAANPDVSIGFQHYLEKKFGTPEALSKAWFLNYWGENLHTWEDLPRRDGTSQPATSWSGRAGARCVSPISCIGRRRWCASAQGTAIVTTDYGGMMKRDVNEGAIAESLDIVADNIYHGTQDHYDGSFQALQSDFSRSLKRGNFLVRRLTRRQSDGLRRVSTRPTMGSCAKMSTRIWPAARTWWSTGTGPLLRRIRRPIGRGSCRTIWNRTASMRR